MDKKFKSDMKITIPTNELMNSVEKDQQFTYKGRVYKAGDLIRMRIFDNSDQYKLFYNEENKMLMFHDDITGKNYNVLGYLENII